MSTGDPDKFKIRLDEEDPVALQQEELKNRKMDKLNQRITLLYILLPCLVILLMVAGYMEIKKRLATNRDASTTAVSNLYEKIDGQLENLTASIQSMDKTLGSHKAEIENALMDIAKLQSHFSDFETSTVDKQEQKKALNEINQQIAPIQNRVDDLKAEIQAMDEVIAQNRDKVSEQMKNQAKTLKKLQAKLSDLDKNNLDMKTFRDRLNSEIEALAAKNNQLKKQLNQLRIELIKIQKQNFSGSENNGASPGIIEQTIE